MANSNSPFGLRPVTNSAGTRALLREYDIAAAYNTRISEGDPVRLLASGTVARYAAAADALLGVFAGCKYYRSDGSIVYSSAWPGTQTENGKALVYADPDQEFIIQHDGAFAAADVGQNASLITPVDGDTSFGQSKIALDTSTMATTAGLQLKILELYNTPSNEYGDYAIVRVKINNHQLANNAVAGI